MRWLGTLSVVPAKTWHLDELDRVFLKDVVSLAYSNRLLAFEALFASAATPARAKESAVNVLRIIAPERPLEQVQDAVEHLREAVRVQTTIYAKMLAEYVATLEDLGALCYAVRCRGRDGILRTYISSKTPAVADTFEELLKHKDKGLPSLLRMPPLEPMEKLLTPERFAAVSEGYAQLPKHLVAIADAYRVAAATGTFIDFSNLPTNWQDLLIVLLDVDGDAALDAKRGLAALVFNKLKHRFMVIDSAADYAALPSRDKLRAVGIEKNMQRVTQLRDAMGNATRCGAELVAILQMIPELN